MKANQFDVMEATCKAKVLRPFKVPSGKRAPLITERDERQHAYRRGRRALSLSGLCTTLDMLHMQFAVCFRCLCSGREAPATLTAPKEMGRTRALQQFVLWRSPSEWPRLGGGRTEMWLVPSMGGTGRGTRAKECRRGTKTSLSSDTGTEIGQGQQGCQARIIILMEMMHLYQ